jgi:NADP-dependent 3-hydroxy acid dehydrogenase YdfG
MGKPLVAITGAGSGIGAGTAAAFSRAGYPLLLTARRVERPEGLGLRHALCRRADVTDADEFQTVVDHAESVYGPVDLLVNNAGCMALEQIAQQSPADWRR